MSSKQIKISDTFEQSTCSICGSSEINQYFRINDNFIEYCGTFFSFREILAEALDLYVTHTEGSSMEICLDCKDKVIKFYHFKRRAKEMQKKNLAANRPKAPVRDKTSKVVQNIVTIVEEYTERCLISSIKIDETGQTLIIQSRDPHPAKDGHIHHVPLTQPPVKLPPQQQQQQTPSFQNERVIPSVKNEPVLTIEEENSYTDNSVTYSNTRNEPDEDDFDSFQHYDSSEPGTSTSTPKAPGSKKNWDSFEDHETQKLKERRKKRMELLRQPNNLDLYERHKAQARERTRRYREKIRMQKMQAEARMKVNLEASKHRSQSMEDDQPPDDNNGSFPFFQFAQVKLEEASDQDEEVVFT